MRDTNDMPNKIINDNGRWINDTKNIGSGKEV
jgi:hypothetical protein